MEMGYRGQRSKWSRFLMEPDYHRQRSSWSHFATKPDYCGLSSLCRFLRGPGYHGQTLRNLFLQEPVIQERGLTGASSLGDRTTANWTSVPRTSPSRREGSIGQQVQSSWFFEPDYCWQLRWSWFFMELGYSGWSSSWNWFLTEPEYHGQRSSWRWFFTEPNYHGQGSNWSQFLMGPVYRGQRSSWNRFLM